jgi:hypothetical protein
MSTKSSGRSKRVRAKIFGLEGKRKYLEYLSKVAYVAIC